MWNANWLILLRDGRAAEQVFLGQTRPNVRLLDTMKDSQAKLSEIYSFRAIGAKLGTAGQPTQRQFQTVREGGFEAVINLALPTSDNAIPNEGSVVTER
jgi:hypothetical protein